MTTLRAGPSLGAGLAITRLGLYAFWGRYFALGGSNSLSGLLVYLDGDTAWTLIEHDIAAQALNEYCDTMGLGYLVAYAHELVKSHPGGGDLLPPATIKPTAQEESGAVGSHERQQTGDELFQRTAALRLLGQALAHGVSESAGRIAQTMDELGRVRDAIANNGVSTAADHPRENADRVRRFAEHERHEQQRWSR